MEVLRRISSLRCCSISKRFFSILILPFLLVLYIFHNGTHQYSNQYIKEESTKTTYSETVSNSTKTILIWNAHERIELEIFGAGRKTFFDPHHCPVNDCFITQNRSWTALKNFDAILFNMPPLSIHKFPLNEERRPEQRYVYFSQEPPVYIGEEMDKFNHLFNWTMSYARHSDIRYHYGEVLPLPSAPKDPASLRAAMHSTRQGENYATGKTKMVAWYVSHCFTQSRREKYVSLLRQYIPVDIYGGCYTLRCDLNHTSFLSTENCYNKLDQDYKFYLAFENSFCKDYVTEKFFDILQRRIIPIVMGGANYSAIAPPHSYIDAVQYSPRELAAYLKLLASDDKLYNEYFWWKPHYQLVSRYPVLSSRALCTLCEMLHHNKTPSVYHDLGASWSQATQCTKAHFKGVRIFMGIF